MKNVIPNALREHRKRIGLKQIDVALKLGFKSSDRISHWEKGLAYPSVPNLFKLADIFGICPHYLYPQPITENSSLDSHLME